MVLVEFSTIVKILYAISRCSNFLKELLLNCSLLHTKNQVNLFFCLFKLELVLLILRREMPFTGE